MAMESVKMGRIPKKVKEKALKDYHKQQEKKSQRLEDNHETGLSYDDDIDDFERDDYSLSSMKRESVSSLSSYSSSSSSSMNMRQSIDSNQDIHIVSQGKQFIFYHLILTRFV
jgi:hypothetical protein